MRQLLRKCSRLTAEGQAVFPLEFGSRRVGIKSRRKARLPRVPRWETVQRLLTESSNLRERAIVALMAYGGLRRSEVVALDVGDYAPEFAKRSP